MRSEPELQKPRTGDLHKAPKGDDGPQSSGLPLCPSCYSAWKVGMFDQLCESCKARVLR